MVVYTMWVTRVIITFCTKCLKIPNEFIRRKLKDRQYNGQTTEDDRQYNGQTTEDEKANYSTKKTKDWATRAPIKTGGKLRCSGRWGLPSPLVAHVALLKLTIRLPEDMQRVLYCGIEALSVIRFFFLFSFSFIQGNLRLSQKRMI